VAKYRGSIHGTNEYPFLIDEEGISVIPITSLGLEHAAFLAERVSTGIPQLDDMLGGQGYYRGSTILVSGTAGTGKSSVAAPLCPSGRSSVRSGFSTSLSKNPLPRSCGTWAPSVLTCSPGWKRASSVQCHAPPAMYGLEMHLAMMHKKVNQFNPAIVIVDPITALINAGNNEVQVKAMLTRLVDFLKVKNVSQPCFTSLTPATPHWSTLILPSPR
jgi:circadian clock protein KaiC